MSNTQQKLSRIKPPRVHITYDVETGNAFEKAELPFVIGVISDLSNGKNPKDLNTRSFVQVDKENFNKFLAHVKPQIQISVPDKLNNSDNNIIFNLEFSSMDSFDPSNIILQNELTKKLFNMLVMFKDLLAKLEGNEKLENKLNNLLNNEDLLNKLASDNKLNNE